LQDDPADHWADHRAARADQAHQAHHPAGATGAGCPSQQSRHQRIDSAGTDTLENAEDDQATDVPGQAGGDGSRQKKTETKQPQALGAEPVDGPGGDRDGDREGQQVAGRDLADRRQRGVKPGGERVVRYSDYRAVQDAHDPTKQDYGDQPSQFWVKSVVTCLNHCLLPIAANHTGEARLLVSVG
jgi:hypothetical protein